MGRRGKSKDPVSPEQLPGGIVIKDDVDTDTDTDANTDDLYDDNHAVYRVAEGVAINARMKIFDSLEIITPADVIGGVDKIEYLVGLGKITKSKE